MNRKVAKASKHIELFVSTQGNDRWSGTLADPAANGKDGPLATVARARDIVRKLRKAGAAGAVKVHIRGGTYYMDQPLVFTPADGGTAKAPVVYAAYEGESPVLSGGQRIADWTIETVNGQTCWTATLPQVAQGQWNFIQLFVNGQRRWRPRLPKKGYHRFERLIGDDTGFAWSRGPDRAGYAGSDIQPWKNLPDVRLVALQLWFEAHHRIREVDVANRVVHFRAKSLGNLHDDHAKDRLARYFVENVFEALDTPGEFYLDRPAGKLYYIPMPNEQPATAEVIAPRLNTLVKFEGADKQRVAHIRMENIAMQHADWDYGDDNPGSIQAAFKVPGAVIMDRAEQCVLYGCQIAHIAQYGVDMMPGCTGCKIVACSIQDMGAGGVRIGHEWMNRVNETVTAVIEPKYERRPMNATVADCQIHDGSLIHYSAIGVWVGNAGYCRIVHNHIFNLNYTGISVGWTWGYAPTATVDNRIEHNHIHHINWDGILSYNGGIYTLGMQPGTVLRGNLIHHVGMYTYGGWGIYPDEGSSDMIIENNITHHTVDAGYSTHYGRDTVARNNIFALSRDKHLQPVGREENHRATIFERNIVYWREGSLKRTAWPLAKMLLRDNLFWNASGPIDFGHGTTLEQLQQQGQNVGSIAADPLFLDPEAGDFTLRPDSPALKLGFKPIDMSGVGPRLRGRRPASFDAWRAPADKPKEIVRTYTAVEGNTLQITFDNVGTIPASGSVRLKITPVAAAELSGIGKLAFRNLKPGQQKTIAVPVKLLVEHGEVMIETLPRGKGLVPAMLVQFFRPTWVMPRVAGIDSPAAVTAALATAAAKPVRAGENHVADIKAAIAGDHLAVWADVRDARVQQGTLAWEGSCIELFGSTASKDKKVHPGQRDPIGQVFLVPAAGSQPCAGRLQDGTAEKPAPDIRLATCATAGGYELAALVPLSLLKAQADLAGFVLEARVTTRLAKDAEPIRPGVFNAADAWGNNSQFGRVVIQEEDKQG